MTTDAHDDLWDRDEIAEELAREESDARLLRAWDAENEEMT